jgi:N-acetylmuramoyl-L-alanine amidase
MRSILVKIVGSLCHGKRRAAGARLLLLAACSALAACAGTGGVRNTSRSFTTVVIDAGHGGHDAGTRSSRLMLEKQAALDTALRLDRKLRAAGFRTVLTRKGDYFVGLDARNAVSNRERNAIFVSIHFNEARAKRYIRGAETYYSSSPSAELARRILRHLGAVPGNSARFAKTARFRVIRKNRNPAVLVECGYMSNRGEAARVATPGYREALAGAIAAAIAEQRGRVVPP